MKVVISLTTIPERKDSLGHTLASIARQTRQPDEVRLYTVPDVGPLTKLSAVVADDLPADTIVVTVDDDIVYEREWLSTLIAGVECYPDNAVGFSGWNVNGSPVEVSGPCDVVEGWAGVAYRKKWFGADVMRIPEEWRNVDDVWISSYLADRAIGRLVLRTPMTTNRIGRNPPGLSNRPGFAEMNRRAAKALFP